MLARYQRPEETEFDKIVDKWKIQERVTNPEIAFPNNSRIITT
jgi:hypothetical protein